MDQLADNEIRIIELLPGEEGAPIRCEARVELESGEMEYEALSYVWGNHLNQATIEVSGRSLQITKTLHTALSRLRLSDEPRSLWIDQLCINQDDLKEKAAQVQKMRSIYSNCTRCLIWLGEVDAALEMPDAVNAVSFLECLASTVGPSTDDYKQARSRLESMPTFLSAMQALRSISVQDCPWWHRVWTVQESILPSDKAFIWGPLQITWDTLVNASEAWVSGACDDWLDGEYWDVAIEAGGLGHFLAKIIWIRIAEGDNHDLFQSMIRWRSRKATDPLDNIYALTGLHTPGEFPRIEKCDYSLSVVRLYSEFTVDLINKFGLIVLGFDPRLEPEIATPGVPRWALDMKSWPNHTIFHWYIYWGYGYYHANDGLTTVPVEHNTEDNTLGLSGSLVDTVKLIGDGYYFTEEEGGQPPVSLLKSWLELYIRDLESSTRDTSSTYPPSISPSTTATAIRAFSKLVIGESIQNPPEWQFEREATDEDVDNVTKFIETGSEEFRDSSISGMARNQRFFVTENGMMGIGHLDTRPGDEVWVFSLGELPFVVRPKTQGGTLTEHFDFVGQCYVQGIMQGEMFKQDESKPPQRTIQIH
ncbi:unnamed protein product [Clonostachys rosea]|uniref:Heterokaryon incompatibility domain-containing protein n=1 Tax=Bionectria ochroleuca TaxID=29856 RepID=A0ABY6UYU1_BIOOC|nr:unnamed protein product [Clonostachys rosea]